MFLAPLNNSVVFKKLFRDPEVLTEFVHDLTGASVHFEAKDIELEKQLNMARPIVARASNLIGDQQLTSAERTEIINETEWERNLRNNREEGRKEGRMVEKQTTAGKMLRAGFTPEQIASFVELPVDEIVLLKNDDES